MDYCGLRIPMQVTRLFCAQHPWIIPLLAYFSYETIHCPDTAFYNPAAYCTAPLSAYAVSTTSHILARLRAYYQAAVPL